MTTKMFLDERLLKFEKQASVDLRDPATWSEDILTTLFADKPYAGNYQAKVVYKKKDPETGYAFGYVELSAEQNTNVVKIPFVVDSSKLKSMDVISTNSKILPLTRPRLEEAIFTPKVLGDRIDDKDVYNQTEQAAYSNVYPPSRQVGYGQVSTKISALLPKIKNTMAPADLQKFASQLMGDKDLHKLAMNKDSVLSALRIFAEAEKMEKKASAAPKVNPPDPAVIQMSVIKDPANKTCSYRVKTASYLAYRPDIEVLDRASAINKYGSTSVRVADARGHLTATFGSNSSDDGVPGLDPICRSGIYRIVGMDGTLGMGVVVDKVFGMDGSNPTKLLFTDGDKYSMQDDMVGRRVGNIDCRQWENKTPKGMGIFVWGDTDDEFKCSSSCGAPECTMPVSVELVEDSNGQEEINVNDLTGKSYKVVKAPVKTLIYTKEVTLIPDKAFFIPTNTLFPVSDGKSVEKIAEARDLDKSVLIKFTSDQFSFSGNPVEGLESKEKTAMSWADAQFLGCSLGMTPEFSESKLAQAMKYGKTTVKVAQSLTPFRVFETKVMAKVASYTKAVNDHISSLKSYLLKEAVAIGDEESVDAILSLGFMNPDNIEKFVEDLPVLEKAQQKLCELLLATRLGLKEIDEGALESAVKSLEKSIEGLKRLAHTIVAGGAL